MIYERQLQRSTDRELDLIECEDELIGEMRSLQRILSEAKVSEYYKASWSERIETIEEKIKSFFAIAVSIDYIDDLATVEEMTKEILKQKGRSNGNV